MVTTESIIYDQTTQSYICIGMYLESYTGRIRNQRNSSHNDEIYFLWWPLASHLSFPVVLFAILESAAQPELR